MPRLWFDVIVIRFLRVRVQKTAPLFFIFLLSACTIPVSQHASVIQTSYFPIYTNAESLIISDPLTIVIEGDGNAWTSRYRHSKNPTPKNAVGLDIAYQLKGIYVARPCQYLQTPECHPLYWTSGRFHEKVIASVNEAVNTIKEQYNAKRLKLVGYSGGGVVAGLVAARRDDVVEWVTVASPIDMEAWIAHHHVSPLKSSLSLTDVQEILQQIPQTHYVGAQDTIVPWSVHQRLKEKMKNNTQAQWIIIPKTSHEDWVGRL